MTSADAAPDPSRECGVSAAAELLGGCTGQTVRNLIGRGEITARRQPRGSRFVWKVSRASLETYRRRAGTPSRTRSELRPGEQLADFERRLTKLEAQMRSGARETMLIEEAVEHVRQTGSQHQRALDLLHNALALLRPDTDEGE